jgi:hypothetical protein
MLDVALVKTVIDLVNLAGGYAEWTARGKRQKFAAIFEPLYPRLQVVCNEYYSIVHDASVRLREETPDLKIIFDDIDARRSALIIARNGIVGEVDIFRLQSLGDSRVIKQSQFRILAHQFYASVYRYFYQRRPKLMIVEHGGGSAVADIQRMILSVQARSSEVDDGAREALMFELLKHVVRTLVSLERDWIEVARAFAELREFCHR